MNSFNTSEYSDEGRENKTILKLGTTLTAYNNELDEAVARYKAGSSVSHETAINTIREAIEKYHNNE